MRPRIAAKTLGRRVVVCMRYSSHTVLVHIYPSAQMYTALSTSSDVGFINRLKNTLHMGHILLLAFITKGLRAFFLLCTDRVACACLLETRRAGCFSFSGTLQLGAQF